MVTLFLVSCELVTIANKNGESVAAYRHVPAGFKQA